MRHDVCTVQCAPVALESVFMSKAVVKRLTEPKPTV